MSLSHLEKLSMERSLTDSARDELVRFVCEGPISVTWVQPTKAGFCFLFRVEGEYGDFQTQGFHFETVDGKLEFQHRALTSIYHKEHLDLILETARLFEPHV